MLIHPPVAKICEPPAGIARLAGSLRSHGLRCLAVDLNLEAMLDQLESGLAADNTWTSRALKHRATHLAQLRTPALYRSAARYQRAVSDLSRILDGAGHISGSDLSFADFNDPRFSPLSSADLLECSRAFQDHHFYPFFRFRLEALLEQEQPDYIGISFSYLSQALAGFAMLGFLRQHYPEVRTIAGGGLITSWMQGPFWNEPFSELIDHCIGGAGETELLRVLGHTAQSPLGSFDYDDFQWGRYLAPGRILPYAASSGCYWKKCRFCPDYAEDLPYLKKVEIQAVDELQTLTARYDAKLVHLLDNAVSPLLMRALIDRPLPTAWYGFARFERELEDADFCLALKHSGCTMLKLGLESGSQQVLDRLNKGIELGRVARILANLRRASIATYVYLLFGTPEESETEALKTLDFVQKHHHEISFFNLAIFNMPLCSADAAEQRKRFDGGDLSLYCDFSHPLGWGRKAVRTFLQKHFRKESLIRPIQRKNPGVFGSSHAPFFTPGFSLMQNDKRP